MRNYRRQRLAFLTLLLAWSGLFGAMPLQVVDDQGRLLQLIQPAQRIVSLSPHATELIFAAGAGDKLAGVSAFSDFPPQVKALPRIGDAAHLDRESLLQLRPDLVVAWPSGNQATDIAWLKELGIPLYLSEPDRLEAIAENILELGILAGSTKQAEAAANNFLAGLRSLKVTAKEQSVLRVFVQIWPQPLITVGGKHLISQVLSLCGGQSVFSDLKTPAAGVSREAVIISDPQVIVATVSPADGDDPFVRWRQWKNVSAVRNQRFVKINGDYLSRATPRILQGAESICRALRQDAGAD